MHGSYERDLWFDLARIADRHCSGLSADHTFPTQAYGISYSILVILLTVKQLIFLQDGEGARSSLFNRFWMDELTAIRAMNEGLV